MAEAASHVIANSEPGASWVGRSIPRVEDSALLTGRGRFIDDLGVRPGTLHAAILRSPHAHADIVSIDLSAARQAPGVVVVLHGDDIKALTTSLVVGVKAPVECWPIAVGRVRYVGEPVAIVVATDRYLAEDAVDLIEVRYQTRRAVVDPRAALSPDAPVVHHGFAGNVASDRTFRYGDPEQAFAKASRTISIDVRYPRNSCTPIETYGVVAEYDPGEDSYDVLANFQGPFSIHAVLSRALKVPGNRLRLRTPPDSGGSFGVKQGVFPYIVLIAAAARAAGRPVKWIEDRLEHLTASVSATNRAITLAAAVTKDGRILALDWDQVEDCGAHLRAPEPATLYRMHGNLTGAYDIRHLAVRNRVVVTNKTPTGLNRGFGGPQVYFALERLVQRIAIELGLDPLDVIVRNLVSAEAFPYRTASGALLDSGNYQEAIRRGVDEGALTELKSRRDAARAQGRLYGIGYTAVVEPSVSNMGYITTVLTPAERRKAGPKNGAQATATVAIDPVGSVTVHVASVPQGPGPSHRSGAGRRRRLGLKPADIRVNIELDTAKDAWSIASGNYSSRFAPAVAGTAKLAAQRIAQRWRASPRASSSRDRGNRIRRRPGYRSAIPTRYPSRASPASHWSPGALPDGVAPGHARNRVLEPAGTDAAGRSRPDQHLAHLWLRLRFLRRRNRPRHRCGADRQLCHHARLRNDAESGMADGQIRGGFAQGLGAALYEEFAYGADGSFLSGTFADYLLPTTAKCRIRLILHMETPSPFTPLGCERHRRRQLHEHAGLHRQCGRRCARAQPDRHIAAGAGETRAPRARC